MSFTLSETSFIISFRFLSSSLDSLVKTLRKGHVKYLRREFDNNALIPVKQKWFCLFELMSDFEKFK